MRAGVNLVFHAKNPDFVDNAEVRIISYSGSENLAPELQLEDSYTKKTCLWTNDKFIMPEPKKVEPVLGSKMHKIPPGPERQNLRSVTPMGFAQAVYEANS